MAAPAKNLWHSRLGCACGHQDPHRPRSVQCRVDRMSGRAFNSTNNFLETEGLLFLRFQRHENHVHVVRHHYDDVELHFFAVVMQAVFQHKIPGGWREFPSQISVEGDEMGPASSLHVGKVATVVVLAYFHHFNFFQDRVAPPPRRCPGFLLTLASWLAKLKHSRGGCAT